MQALPGMDFVAKSLMGECGCEHVQHDSGCGAYPHQQQRRHLPEWAVTARSSLLPGMHQQQHQRRRIRVSTGRDTNKPCGPAAPALLCLLAGPVAEQVLLLENIATSIKTGPNQLPTIHNLLLEAVSVLLSSRYAWALSMRTSRPGWSGRPRQSSQHTVAGLGSP